MRVRSQIVEILICALFICFLISCNSSKKNTDWDTEMVSEQKSYFLVEGILSELQEAGTDTILVYQRTCVGCCDYFYLIFKSGKDTNIKKVFFSFDDFKTHIVSSRLEESEVFETLSGEYQALLQDEILPAQFINVEKDTISILIDHYCYSEINIIQKGDTILTGRIKDLDLLESFSGSPLNEHEVDVNINFERNRSNKWLVLENEILEGLLQVKSANEKEREVLEKRKLF